MNVSQLQLSAFQNPLPEPSLGVRPFFPRLLGKSAAPYRSLIIDNLKQELRFRAERFGGVALQSFESLGNREVGGERREGQCQNSGVRLTRIGRDSEVLNEPLLSVGYPSCVLLVSGTDCGACRSLTGLRQGVSAMDGEIFVQRWRNDLIFDEISGGLGGESGEERNTRVRSQSDQSVDDSLTRGKV